MITLLDIKNSSTTALTPESGVTRIFMDSNKAIKTVDDAGVVTSLPSTISTDVLTNKAITQRVVTTTDDATAVIDVTITDVYQLTAIANATVFTFSAGATDGQKLVIRFKDAGVAKGLTFTGLTAIGVTLPTITTAGKWHYVHAEYNLAGTAWHAVQVN